MCLALRNSRLFQGEKIRNGKNYIRVVLYWFCILTTSHWGRALFKTATFRWRFWHVNACISPYTHTHISLPRPHPSPLVSQTRNIFSGKKTFSSFLPPRKSREEKGKGNHRRRQKGRRRRFLTNTFRRRGTRERWGWLGPKPPPPPPKACFSLLPLLRP